MSKTTALGLGMMAGAAISWLAFASKEFALGYMAAAFFVTVWGFFEGKK